MDAVISATTERHQRFQRVFLRKIDEVRRERDFGATFPVPPHKLGRYIEQNDMARIRAPSTSDVGLSLVYFISETGPVLLTTTGVFFWSKGGLSNHVSWAELDAVMASNLAYDDFTVKLESDKEALEEYCSIQAKRSTKGQPMIATIVSIMVMVMGMSAVVDNAESILAKLVLIIIFAFLFLIAPAPLLVYFTTTIRAAARTRYLNAARDKYNIIYMRIRHSRINVGPLASAEDITTCMILALGIFRLQREKYDKPAENP